MKHYFFVEQFENITRQNWWGKAWAVAAAAQGPWHTQAMGDAMHFLGTLVTEMAIELLGWPGTG